MDTETSQSTEPPPNVVGQHEYLLVAEGCTLAAACCYLRDLGRTVIGHEQRDDGRWVVKLMAEAAQ